MEYYLFSLFSLLILSSCEHSKKKTKTNNIKEKDTISNKVTFKNSKEKDTLIYSFKTNLDVPYRADYRSNNRLYVITKNDTLINQEEIGIIENTLRFEDYNNDGYFDLRYAYNSNYIYEMIMLFDSKAKLFRKIENIDIPEHAYSSNIKNTDLYYSYSPNGCGKNNWESYLFSISDYKVKPKGLIEYKQCVDDKKGMYVFKINGDEKVLIDMINLKEADKKKLENHWNKYLKKIANQ